LLLVLSHGHEELGGDSSSIWVLKSGSIGVHFEPSIKMPVNFIGVPIFDKAVHHLEADDLVREGEEIVVHGDVQILEKVVEAMLLDAVHVVLPCLLGLVLVIPVLLTWLVVLESGRHCKSCLLL